MAVQNFKKKLMNRFWEKLVTDEHTYLWKDKCVLKGPTLPRSNKGYKGWVVFYGKNLLKVVATKKEKKIQIDSIHSIKLYLQIRSVIIENC